MSPWQKNVCFGFNSTMVRPSPAFARKAVESNELPLSLVRLLPRCASRFHGNSPVISGNHHHSLSIIARIQGGRMVCIAHFRKGAVWVVIGRCEWDANAHYLGRRANVSIARGLPSENIAMSVATWRDRAPAANGVPMRWSVPSQCRKGAEPGRDDAVI
jgi:hypothetical protein